DGIRYRNVMEFRRVLFRSDGEEIISLLAQYGKIGSNITKLPGILTVAESALLPCRKRYNKPSRNYMHCGKKCFDWQVIILAVLKIGRASCRKRLETEDVMS